MLSFVRIKLWCYSVVALMVEINYNKSRSNHRETKEITLVFAKTPKKKQHIVNMGESHTYSFQVSIRSSPSSSDSASG